MSLDNSLLFACALVAALLPAAVYAQGQGRGQGQGHGPAAAQTTPAPATAGAHGTTISATLVFSPDERSLIHGWFVQNPVQPAALPPGIARNLERGKPLPPGIAKRTLPQPLLAQLPPRDGYEYLLIGASVVLVAAATGIIVDIIADAL